MADAIGCKLRIHANGGHIIPWQFNEAYNTDLELFTTEANAFWKKK